MTLDASSQSQNPFGASYTGNLDATIKAVETVDNCIGDITTEIHLRGGKIPDNGHLLPPSDVSQAVVYALAQVQHHTQTYRFTHVLERFV